MPSPPTTPDTLDFDYLKRLVGNAPSTIVEVGANDGSDTIRLLQAFPTATVYAFEPDPRAIVKFRRNVRSDRAHLVESAVGAAAGIATFHTSSGLPSHVDPAQNPEIEKLFPEGWDQSGSLRNPKSHLQKWPWVKFEMEITVPVTTLDAFFQETSLRGIDLIWADTQGAEGDLIAGGALALSKTRYLYTEYSNEEWYEGQISLAQILERLPNFNLLAQYPMDALLENQAVKVPDGWAARLKKRLVRAISPEPLTCL